MSKMNYSSSSKMGEINFTNLGYVHPVQSINPFSSIFSFLSLSLFPFFLLLKIKELFFIINYEKRVKRGKQNA